MPVIRRVQERGAMAIVLALVTCLVVVPLGALAVDIGQQRVARSDMQALADTVALDLARNLNGGTLSSYSLLDLQQQASTDAARSDTTVGSPPTLAVELGTTDAAEFGTSGYFTALTDPNAVPTAVRVTAGTTVSFGLARALPGGGVGSGSASRSAIASSSVPSVCFSVGTRTLSLNTSASALGPVLDQILKVNLDAVDYDGIVGLKDASVPIVGLMTQLGIGSPSQLATTNVSLAGFMMAMTRALQQSGDTADAALVSAVQLGVSGLPIKLSNILAVDSGTSFAGLDAEANVLDLIAASVIAANGTNSISANLPGVTSVSITQPPQVACGAKGASAHSAQIKLTLDPALATNLVDDVGLTDAKVHLEIEVGSGTATVASDISCLPDRLDLAVTTGAVDLLGPVPPAQGQVQAHITLARFLASIPGLGTVLKLALQALGLDPVGLDIALSGSVASTSETRTITFPPASATVPEVVVPESGIGSALTLSAASVLLTTGQSGLGNLLGGLLNQTLTTLLSGVAVPLVNTVVGPALTATLSPLLTFLGIKLGVAEVNFTQAPVCAGVKLIG